MFGPPMASPAFGYVKQKVTASGDVVGVGNINKPHLHFASSAADQDLCGELLGVVRSIWIEGVLADSVHGATLMRVRKVPRPDAVRVPWRGPFLHAASLPAETPPDAPIEEVFAASRRRLLILGEPGSGKTTTLLELASICIEAASADPTKPVPVVLPLSEWTLRERNFARWVADTLNRLYGIGRRPAARLLASGRLLLLLDGLDEIRRPDARVNFVEALHLYLDGEGIRGVAITCRSREFHDLAQRLNLWEAVSLQPLTPGQIDGFLEQSGSRLHVLGASLRSDPALADLARSPLMLSVMSQAFVDAEEGELPRSSGASAEERRSEVFRAYVDRMFQRAADPRLRERENSIRHALPRIAAQMVNHGQTVLTASDVQPSWLPDGEHHLIYVLVTRGVVGLLLAVAVCAVTLTGILFDQITQATESRILDALDPSLLVCGVLSGLGVGLLDAWRLRPTRRLGGAGRRDFAPLVVATHYLIAAFCFQLTMYPNGVHLYWSVLVAITFNLGRRGANARFDINLRMPLQWSFRGGIRAVQWTCLAALLAYALDLWTTEIRFKSLTVLTLEFLALLLPIATIIGGLRYRAIDRVDPTAGLTLSVRRNLVIAATLMLVGGLASAVSFVLAALILDPDRVEPIGVGVGAIRAAAKMALGCSILGTLWYGGSELIKHFVLRRILAATDVLPLDADRLFVDCTRLILMQRVGSGYMFVHKLLLDHFAAQYHPLRE